MAGPRQGRRRRIFDHATIETGEMILEWTARLHLAELSKQLHKEVIFSPEQRAQVVSFLRTEAITRDDILRELGQNMLPDLVTVMESRRRIREATGEPATAVSDIEEFVRSRLGEESVKPRVAVITPITIARVVEAIHKRHLELRNWFAELGLSVEDGAQLMYDVLDYTSPRGATPAARAAAFQRRVDRRGAILWEWLMPFQKNVVVAERKAALDNALDWIRAEPAQFGVPPRSADELAAQVKARFEAAESVEPRAGQRILNSQSNPGIGEIDVIAENLWMVRFTEVRDEGGRLIMDHLRGLVSVTADGIVVTPVGVGESKFGSKGAELLAQAVRNVGRARETFRAANLPNPAVLPVSVRWGERLVLIAQTESQRPVTPPANYQASVSKAAGKAVEVEFIRAGTLEGAERSRKAVAAVMRLLEMENLGE